MRRKLTTAVLLIAFAPCLASISLLFSQEIVEGTPKQRIAEAGSGQSGASQAESQNGQQKSADTLSAAPPPSAQTCDETCQQGRQNIQIQRRLEWFTGGLVLVGFLQAGTMVWQAVLLRNTRDDVHVQAEWMKTQAGIMREQTNQMVSQTLGLASSISAAQASAEAAGISAKAAMGVAVPTLMLYQFQFADPHGGGVFPGYLGCPQARVEVKNYGQSPAFLKAYHFAFTIADLPDEPVFDGPALRIELEKAVVEPGGTHVIGEGFVSSRKRMSIGDIERFANREVTLKVYGWISYGDVFGSPLRYMRFCKALIEPDVEASQMLIADDGGPKYTGQA